MYRRQVLATAGTVALAAAVPVDRRVRCGHPGPARPDPAPSMPHRYRRGARRSGPVDHHGRPRPVVVRRRPLLDAGLIFVCFQRDPGQQFIPVQRRLAERDALNAFSQHTASAVFACPPAAGAGPATGAWIGSGLFA
ncbi:MAG: hypothetical protein E6F99_22580 [Actinobacteria bacterium]|nr:MAG: hypothetical protein E6F99_22580 [Actinomycetota bacterium]